MSGPHGSQLLVNEEHNVDVYLHPGCLYRCVSFSSMKIRIEHTVLELYIQRGTCVADNI